MARKTAKQRQEERDERLRNEGAEAALRNLASGKPPTNVELLNAAQFANPTGGPIASGETLKPQTAGAKVIVGCKLDITSYAIQHTKMDEKFEQNMQGGRTVTEGTRQGRVVVLRGTAYPRGTPPKGFPAAPIIVNGAALNFNVDRDWMEEWLKQNKLNPVVMNNLVFIASDIDRAQGISKDLAEVSSMLGPVVPGADNRVTRSTRKDEVSDIEAGQR